MKNAMFGLSEWFCKKLQNFVLSKSVQTAFCKPREVEESKPNRPDLMLKQTICI